MYRNEPYSNSRTLDKLFGDSDRKFGSSGSDAVHSIEPEAARPVHSMFAPREKPSPAAPTGASRAQRGRRQEADDDDSAVKKFGSAKAISSAQFFGDQVLGSFNK